MAGPMQPARRRLDVVAQHPHIQAQCLPVAGLGQGQLRRLPVCGVQAGQPLLLAGTARQLEGGSQGRVQLQVTLRRPLPPARAQLLLQIVKVGGLLVQLLAAMAHQQRLDQGAQQRQRHVGRRQLGRTGAQQPRLGILAQAAGHQEQRHPAAQRQQLQVVIGLDQALGRPCLQPRLQGAVGGPGPGALAAGVMSPAIGLAQQQAQRAGLPVLGKPLQLRLGGLHQARRAALTQGMTDLAEQWPLPVPALLAQQVADVEQLQQPPLGLAQQPATGVQGLADDRVEIQVQRLPLPVGGLAFEHQPAVPQQVVVQPPTGLPGQRQQGPQRAGQALHPGLVVEPQLQADRWRYLRFGQRGGRRAPAIEQAATHSCRLAWACKRAGSFGTSPTTGSTRVGKTRVSRSRG